MVRDALFNSLGPRVEGARVLDLFAGTGTLGREALRRGARLAIFVERSGHRVAEIRRQLAAEGLADRAEVWRKDALAAMGELGSSGRQFDIVLLDPPYGEGFIPRALRMTVAADVLAPGAEIVAEGHWRDRPEAEPGLVCDREARYGETMLWFYRRASATEEAEPRGTA